MNAPGGDFIDRVQTKYRIGQSAASERGALSLQCMYIPIIETPAGGQTVAAGAKKGASMYRGNVGYWTSSQRLGERVNERI
jgi:hypothetical protein